MSAADQIARNLEIWRAQQAAKAHREAVPGALDEANLALQQVADGELVQLTPPTLATLVREVARLQAALKRANEDLRDEQREGQRAAGEAYSEGRHEGLSEGRGW
ncbi:hypothetical protein [Ramlibacter sp.]|uniref:hypothetical protein n=1 Tax=Ramlibacter sp. TaxID=1917967 RepID=UPI003D0AEFE7